MRNKVSVTDRALQNVGVLLVSMLLISAITIMVFDPRQEITGLVTYDKIETHNYSIDKNYSVNDNERIFLKEGEKITSVKLSGNVKNTGYAKVYLETNDSSYLVFDSDRLDKSATSLVEFGNDVTFSDTTVPDSSLSITLEYFDDSNFDTDNDGIESQTGVVDFSVANSVIGLNEENLCTRWHIYDYDDSSEAYLCYGESNCCDILDLNQDGSNWSSPLYLTYGKYNAGDRVIVRSQIVYANYSLDIDNAYAQVAYSDWAESRAVFIGDSISFVDSCVETCTLDLSEDLLTLDIKVYDSNLSLDYITYKSSSEIENTAPSFELFPEIIIETNESYIINLSQYSYDIDNDNLTYDYVSLFDNLSVTITEDIANITPDKGFLGYSSLLFVANDSEHNAVSSAIDVSVVSTKAVDNRSDNETLTQGFAVIGQPVKWTKKIVLNESVSRLEINLSKDALNINVSSKRDGIHLILTEDDIDIKHDGEIKELEEYEDDKEVEILDEKIKRLSDHKQEVWYDADEVRELNTEISELRNEKNGITGNAIGFDFEESIVSKFIRSVLSGEITGFAVANTSSNESGVELVLTEEVDEVVIEYETPGPESFEIPISDSKKQIIVSSEEHYENILSFTDISDVPRDAIRLYHYQNGSRVDADIYQYEDGDGDGNIDKIYWIVPHLSNQTYDVELDVITIQSYPTVGGTWQVEFTTLGEADLIITGVSGTTFGESLPDDLRSLYLQCDGENVSTAFNGTHVIATDYSCDNETSTHLVEVLTSGKHAQEYRFGNEVGYAYNFAFNDSVTDDFSAGTHNGTLYSNNLSINRTGAANEFHGIANFTSHIFDAGGNATWQNVSWQPGLHYGQGFPGQNTSQADSFPLGIVDNTKDLLLYFDLDDSNMDDTDTIYDKSGYHTLATITDASASKVSHNETGKIGGAFWSDATNDFIRIEDADADYIDTAKEISYSAWINLSVFENSDGFFSKNSFLTFNLNTSGEGFLVNVWRPTVVSYQSLAAHNMTPGRWYHIGFTWDSVGLATFYVNGRVISNRSTLSGDLNDDSTSVLEFARDRGFGGGFLNGSIDEIMVWNRTLNPEEMKRLYQYGAHKINISYRSCDTSACDGETWQGPLTNHTYNSLSGITGRYFQYQAALDSPTGLSAPELYNITIDYSYPVENNSPTFSNPTRNVSSDVNTSTYVEFNITISDDVKLTSYIFSWDNGTGTFVNDSSVNIEGYNTTVSVVKRIESSAGSSNRYQWFAYDANVNIGKSNIFSIETYAEPPTHSAPLLLSDTHPANSSSANITAYNQSTNDPNNLSVKNFYTYVLDDVPFAQVYLPLDGFSGDESQTTIDYSGYSHNWTVEGAIFNRTGGFDGRGAYFFRDDGTHIDHISTNYTEDIHLYRNFTLFMWVNFNRTGQTASVLSANNYTNIGSFKLWFFKNSSDRMTVYLVNRTAGSFVVTDQSGDGVLSAKTWYHVGLRYDGSTLDILRDGVTVQSGSFGPYHHANDSVALTLGRYTAYLPGSNMNGFIDEFYYFNKTLTDEQILAFYQNQSATIVSDQTAQGQQWRVNVTPNNNFADGQTLSSSVVSVQNNQPFQLVPVLNATDYPINGTTANLTAYNRSSLDPLGGTIKSIYNWFVDGVPIAVLHYPMDQYSVNTTNFTLDYSGYGTTGVVQVGATFNETSGIDGRGAYEFDGENDRIFIGSGTVLDSVRNVTVSVWAKFNESQPVGVLHAKSSGSNSSYVMYISNKNIRWDVYATNHVFTLSSAEFSDNKWHHFVGTYNGTHADLYHDGVEATISSQAVTGAIRNATTTIAWVGSIGGATSFNGSIDELYVFNRSLSHEQILALYRNQSNLIVSQETNPNETWSVNVTPHNGALNGQSLMSNNVAIVDNIDPSISSYASNDSVVTIADHQNVTWSVADNFRLHETWVQIQNSTTTYNISKISINGRSANVEYFFDTNDPKGTRINYTFFVNDSYGNVGASAKIGQTVVNAIPTQSTPIINSTDHPVNLSSGNITVFAQNVADKDGDTVKNIYNWFVNDTALALLHMPFEGHSGNESLLTLDYSGRGNSGNVQNVSWNRTGGYDGGGAYEFNGSDSYIDLGTPADLNFVGQTDAFSFGAWVKSFNNSDFQNVIGKSTSTSATRQWALMVDWPNNRITARVGGTGLSVFSPIPSDFAGEWHHLFVTVPAAADGLKVFYDGVEVVSNGSIDTDTNSEKISIGRESGGNRRFFNGTIDEVLVLDRELSPEQVKALYENRTDLIVSQETSLNDEWSVNVTPNDGFENGISELSSNVTVRSIGGRLINPKYGVKFVRYDNRSHHVTNNTQVGNTAVLVGQNNSQNYSGIITIDFSVNQDSRKITSEINRSTAKSVFHNSTNLSGVINRSLLIPKTSGTGEVYVCPGATSLSEVRNDCSGKVYLSVGQTKGSLSMSEIPIDGMQYYKVDGITGTGGGEGGVPNASAVQSNNSVPYIGNHVLLNWTVYDDNDLNYTWLQVQNSTTTFNTTPLALTGTIDQGAYTYNISDPGGSVLSFTVFVNDSAGNVSNSSLVQITVQNTAPTQSAPVLNATDHPTNSTDANLTAYVQGQSDADGNTIKNIYNWFVNGTSLAVLNMPFEGTSTNTNDYSGYERNVNVSSATYNLTGGYDGMGAYYFDGNDDYLGLSDNRDYFKKLHQDNKSYSIVFWLKKLTGSEFVVLTNNDIGWVDGFSIRVTNTSMFFQLGNASVSSAVSWSTTISDVYNEWHHFAFAYQVVDSNYNITAYLDGILINSTSGSSTFSTGNSIYDLVIGNGHPDIGYADYESEGYLDELLFFNRSLLAGQVRALYENRTDLLVSQETSKGDTWSVNVTPNDGISDGNSLMSNNVTIALNSCSYVGVNWDIDCADNCIFSSNINAEGNNVTASGSGTLTFNANLTNFEILTFRNGCVADCSSGNCYQI